MTTMQKSDSVMTNDQHRLDPPMTTNHPTKKQSISTLTLPVLTNSFIKKSSNKPSSKPDYSRENGKANLRMKKAPGHPAKDDAKSSSLISSDARNPSYHDCSHLPIEDFGDPTVFIYSAASAKDPPFPIKLHRILSNKDFQDIITWLPHGRSWRVLEPKAFEEKAIPLFFRHSRYSSFMRQVNGWGFRRVSQGPDLNSYYHELFLRGLPHLCLKMRRPVGKQGSSTLYCATTPDFYSMNKAHPLPEYTHSNPPKSLDDTISKVERKNDKKLTPRSSDYTTKALVPMRSADKQSQEKKNFQNEDFHSAVSLSSSASLSGTLQQGQTRDSPQLQLQRLLHGDMPASSKRAETSKNYHTTMKMDDVMYPSVCTANVHDLHRLKLERMQIEGEIRKLSQMNQHQNILQQMQLQSMPLNVNSSVPSGACLMDQNYEVNNLRRALMESQLRNQFLASSLAASLQGQPGCGNVPSSLETRDILG